MKKHIRIVGLLAFIALAVLSIQAQVIVNGDSPAVEAAKPNVWLLIIPIMVPILIAVAKFFIPKIPSAAIPIIAPILGAIVDWLTTGTFGQGTIMGAIAGSAGVGLREIVDQLRKPSTTDTTITTPTK